MTTAGHDDKMVLDTYVMGHRMNTLLDSGAMGNYISPRVVNRYRLPWTQKEEPYALHNIEGEAFDYNNGTIDMEIDHLDISIQKHKEKVSFDVMDISEHDLVLGLPWLKESNPLINWRTGQLQWNETAIPQDQRTRKKVKFHDDLVTEAGKHEPPLSYKAFRATKTQVVTKTALQPGIRRFQNRGKQQKVRRVIAALRKDLEQINDNIETETNTSPSEDRMKNVPQEYRKYEQLFAESLETGLPEHSQWDHGIYLKEGTTPSFHKIYNLNEKQLETLRDYIDENLKKGYIRPSTSEAGYPVMFVPKKNGKLRLVVDYRRINADTVKDRTPLPLISEMKDRLSGMKWFTALDLKGAYNLIRMKKGHEWMTAFRTKFGLFEYLVMPFGLTNAPATFQRMINNVLREYLDIFVVVYLDDILIFSENLEEHKEHVHKVLQALQNAKLLVEPEKSKFHTQEVDFLGHTIVPGEIRMQKDKIKAVQEWPTPTNVKEVQSFIGFANYYRHFITGIGGHAAPLYNLTKKENTFTWGPEAEQAFQKIKDLITAEPVLAIFNPSSQIELETDASDYALGAQIGQRDENRKVRPIAFYSKKLSGAELNYPIYDKEFLAIINAFKEWRHYLLGSKHTVKVYTDHKNIAHFATTQQLNGRQIRWAEYLSEFDYEIIHRKGSENGRADALSRRCDYMQGTPIATGQLLEMNENGNYQQRQLNVVFKVQDDDPTFQKIKEWTKKNVTHIQEVPHGCDMEHSEVPMYRNKIWLPPPLREQTMKEFHEHPTHGHQGIRKTMERIRRRFDFPGIKEEITKIINNCTLCARSKASRHKPYGELQPLPVPVKPWDSVAFDHITKLPPSKEPMTKVAYDSIFVVTDRLTKYGYFIPYKESSNAEDLAYVFLRTIVSNHGLPTEIVSDRGTTFTANFWQALMAQLGTKHKLSTAYHPQTDGQTERLNQTLEQYLRCYINYGQDDWVTWLPTAQLAYNSSIAEATKVSPSYANFGYNPEAYRATRTGPQAERAILHADRLKELHEEMRKELEYVRQRMSTYANKKRLKGPIFREGDMVYLLRRNIKTKRPSDKLDFKKLGPFPVKKVISKTNYELSLPKTMKIHPIFHISLLETASQDAEPQDCIEVADDTEYEVEQILDTRKHNKERQWLIKWKGYGHEENTWEPIKNLTNCQPLLRQYRQQHPE
jgi:reverse transcriptase-like protein/integrase-like protein/chromodomain-containing protein/aspartyl protease